MTEPIATGYPTLDRQLQGGLRPEDLIVLGGDSGAGCSALALGIAVRVAERGVPVTLLSTEMSATRLAERALAQTARATLQELEGTGLDDIRRADIADAAMRLRALPLTFRTQPEEGWSAELGAYADAWGLLVVDALEGLPWDPRGPRDEAWAARVGSLKRLAIARGAPVLLVTHLGPEVAARADHRPVLRDFGAAGAVQQLADVVMALYREERYRPDAGVTGAAELLVLKDRHGQPGPVDLWFAPAWFRFEDLAEA